MILNGKRLLLVLAPGIIALLLPIVAGPAMPPNPGIHGATWRSVAPIIGLCLLIIGMLAHWKSTLDLIAGRRPYWKTVGFMTIAIIAGVMLPLLVAEVAARLYINTKSLGTVPIFPPYSKVTFHSSEFTYTAEANAMGFRGPEVGARDGLRILAIGDSFTYGWGMDLDATWPKIVERSLGQHGCRAEVLNLGCPGASSDVYAEVAGHGIPLLKPNLVLVNVLQGDDLKQLALGGTMGRLAGPHGGLATLVARISRPKPVTQEEVTKEWQLGTRRIIAHLTPDEQTRLDHLNTDIKERFLAGDLSPHLLSAALKHPRYLEFTLSTSDPELRQAIAALANNLGRIRHAAARADARVIVFSVPWSYVSEHAVAAQRRLGFLLEDSVMGSDAPDEAIRAACRAANVEFHSFTQRFHDESKGRNLFFERDGHFNPEGAALYAEEMSKFLLQQQLPGRRAVALETNAPLPGTK